MIGIDYANGMLKTAESKISDNIRKQIFFEQIDLNNPLEFSDEYFDYIISISVLQSVRDPAFTLKELYRVLKTNGTIIVSLPKLNSGITINPLLKIIKSRLKYLDRRNVASYILVNIKSLGDKYAKIIRWTYSKAEELIASAGFNMVSITEDKQLLVIAEKIEISQVNPYDR